MPVPAPFQRLYGIIRGICAALGLVILFVTLTPIPAWWTMWLTGNRWDEPAGDTLIVLGAAPPVQPGNLLSVSSYWRSVYAVSAWRKAGFRQIIISGDDGTAESMATYLYSQGVPRNVVRLETHAKTTAENASYVAAMLRGSNTGRIALLSSDYHMRRSVAVFQRAGFRDFAVVPVPDGGKRCESRLRRWEVALDLATETAKYFGYLLLGRL